LITAHKNSEASDSIENSAPLKENESFEGAVFVDDKLKEEGSFKVE
jgi:hypothetical protein